MRIDPENKMLITEDFKMISAKGFAIAGISRVIK